LGKIPKKGVKVPDSRDPGQGFYINPSRRGPAVPAGTSDGKAVQAPPLRAPAVGG